MRSNVFEVTSMPDPGSRYCKVGRTHCFYFNKDGVPLITIGPHCNFYIGPMMCITGFLILLVTGIFLGYICPKVGTIDFIVGFLIFSITLYFFFAAALVNPGIVIMSTQMKSRGDFNSSMEKICTECNVIREDFTEHCKKCRVCVEEYDDHYSLLGKCVGKNTIKYFYGLLVCALCMLVFIVTTLFFRFKDKL